MCQAQSSESDDLKIFCAFDGSVVCAAISRLRNNLCPFYRCAFFRFKNSKQISRIDDRLTLIPCTFSNS